VNEILGLPLHPLVVHAVVVLVPLVTLGTVAATLSRTWFERLRVVLAGLAVGAAVAGVVARASGETLLSRVPGSPEVADHANVSDALPWLLLPAAVLTLAWAWAGPAHRWYRALAVAAVAAWLVASLWTVLAGHSGAVSVWGDL
jgi:hypothetical protein